MQVNHNLPSGGCYHFFKNHGSTVAIAITILAGCILTGLALSQGKSFDVMSSTRNLSLLCTGIALNVAGLVLLCVKEGLCTRVPNVPELEKKWDERVEQIKTLELSDFDQKEFETIQIRPSKRHFVLKDNPNKQQSLFSNKQIFIQFLKHLGFADQWRLARTCKQAFNWWSDVTYLEIGGIQEFVATRSNVVIQCDPSHCVMHVGDEIKVWESSAKEEESHLKLKHTQNCQRKKLDDGFLFADNTLYLHVSWDIWKISFNPSEQKTVFGKLSFKKKLAIKKIDNNLALIERCASDIQLWNSPDTQEPKNTFRVESGSFFKSQIVNNKWLVGNGFCIDLQFNPELDSTQAIKSIAVENMDYPKCVYGDSVICLTGTGQQRAFSIIEIPSGKVKKQSVIEWDQKTTLFVRRDCLYLQTPDGDVHRYHFKTDQIDKKFLSLDKWRIKGFTDNLMIVTKNGLEKINITVQKITRVRSYQLTDQF